jgi:hypothetical protein
MTFKGIELDGLHWVNLAVNRCERRAVLNTVMKSQGFHNLQGISGVDEKPLNSQKRLFSVELVDWLLKNYL